MARRVAAMVGWVALVAVLAGCARADEQANDTEPSAPAESQLQTSVAETSESSPVAERWRPEGAMTWQWQLSDLPVDLSVEADVFDIDLFENDASVVAELHARGARAICYVSVGTWEHPRPDRARFPDAVLGEPLDDHPDERWLDVRELATLGPIIESRFDLCVEKGFDAVEPDNVDGYANDSGFDLIADDQLTFNRFVARAAHDRGLGVGLKNDLDQIDELVDEFDFAVNEQCVQYDECEVLEPFLDAGKPVFHAEYEVSRDEACRTGEALGLSSILKDPDLDAAYERCRA